MTPVDIRRLGGRARRLAPEAGWVAFGQMASIALRLVGLKIVTTLLRPGAYGELVVLLTVAALAGSVLLQPLQQAALRFYPDAERDGRLDALRGLVGAPLAWAGAGFTVVAALGSVAWLGVLHQHGSAAAFALATALTLLETWRSLESNFLNAARRQRVYASWFAVEALFRAVLPIPFVHAFGATSASVLGAYVAGCLVTALAFRPWRVRAPSAPGDPAVVRSWVDSRRPEYRHFVLPLVPFAFLGWIVGAADRPMIAALGGTEAAGIYGAIYGLASQPFLAVSAIGTLFFRPMLFAAASETNARRERRVLAAWIAAQVGIGVSGWCALSLLAGPITHLATGPKFWSGATLVPWIAGAYAIQGVQIAFETRLFAQRRTRRLLALQVVGAAVSVVLYLLLIPTQGGLGAARATLGAMVASCATAAALSVRRTAEIEAGP